MEKNKIYNENCLDTMINMPNEYIDLIVTSPPYDNLRKYHGYSFDFDKISEELFRVLKVGGVLVWIVADSTMNGSESGNSFRQALHFKDKIGFNLHDTMVFAKNNPIPLNHNRYEQTFEYMFVFSKGKPKTFNPILEKTKYGGVTASKTRSFYQKNEDNTPTLQNKIGVISDTKIKGNIWYYTVGSTQTKGIKHPAQFPEQLSTDHILSWSNEGDLVYDPFIGSGTTAVSAIKNKRNFIGSEISKDFYDLTNQRINQI
jgi:site-specific DNA-methyltransferase (adenine-specific)